MVEMLAGVLVDCSISSALTALWRPGICARVVFVMGLGSCHKNLSVELDSVLVGERNQWGWAKK
eukprot:11434803-Ditylum_brightwellii.AAC.1